MVKKLNELTTIEEAKSAQYNGKALTRNEDKDIFNNDLLKTNNAVDSTKLRQTAQLLEKALKAKEATIKNSSLLTELKTARTNNAVDYQVAKSQVDEGITNLEVLEGGSPDIQALTKDLHEKEALFKKAEKDLQEKDKEVKDFIKEMTKLQIEYDKAKKRREGIDILVDKLTRTVSLNKADGTPDGDSWDEVGINILKAMVNRNKKYADNFFKITNWIETNVDYFEGRKFVIPEYFSGFLFGFIEKLKDLDEDKLKSSIDSASYINAGDKKKAKDAFNRLINAKVRDGGRISGPLEYSEIDGSDPIEKEGLNLAKRIAEKSSSEITKYKNDDSWPFNAKDEKADRVKFLDLFNFMKIVFPRNNFSNSPLIDSSNALSLKLKDGSDIDKKKYEIKWYGEKALPTSETLTVDSFFDNNTSFAKADFVWTSKAGLVKLFWDAFKDDNDLLPTTDDNKSFYIDADGNKQAREISNFEWNHQYARNRAEDLRITSGFYVAHIKKVVEEAKDKNGNPLNLKFDDKWEEAAFRVALSARNTSSKLIDEMFEKNNKPRIKSTWVSTFLGVKMGDFWKDVKSNFEVSKYNDFRSESIIEEKEAELELKGEEMLLGELAKEKSDLKAKKRQAELEKKLAQKKLDNAQGKTIDQLKESFDKIYGGGPAVKKYDWEELEEMKDILLEMRKRNEITDTYTGYETTLQEEVYDKIQAWFNETSNWLSAEESLEKRIAKRKKDNQYYTDEKRTKDLENLRDYFDNIAGVRNLSPVEKNERKRIDDFLHGRIKLPEDKTPPPVTKFDKPAFKAYFGIDEQTVFDKWKTLDKGKIENVFGDYSKGKSKNPTLISHLNEKGVYNKGGNDSDKRISETGDAAWNKFFKDYDAETVIKTVLVHKNDDALKQDSPSEDKKKELIKNMRENSSAGYNKDDPSQNTFSKDDYGDPTEGEESKVTRDQIVNYLYDEAMGQIKTGSAWGEKKDEKENGGTPTPEKPWWKKFGYAAIWVPILLIIIGLVVFFWKNITEWWNGPAEEEGAGAENKDEEGIEDK